MTSERKVKDLLNGEKVVVLSNGKAYNTIVNWELADYRDDVPPFLEVVFYDVVSKDAVGYTRDLEGSLLNINGNIVILIYKD